MRSLNETLINIQSQVGALLEVLSPTQEEYSAPLLTGPPITGSVGFQVTTAKNIEHDLNRVLTHIGI